MIQRSQPSSTPEPLQLSSEEIRRRKDWLGLSAEDEASVLEVDALLDKHIEGLIKNMYDHFLSFKETRSFFPNEETLSRARNAQESYFRRLTKGNYGDDYVRDRLRIGAAHHRIDLDPKWYLGAYSRVFGYLLPILAESLDRERLAASLSALLKVVFFDMGLAIETYNAGREAAIRRHRDAVAELETERRVTKTLLENSPIGIVKLDKSLTLIECNQAFLDMAGLVSQEDLKGLPLLKACPFVPAEPFHQVIEGDRPYQASGEEINFTRDPAGARTYWDWAAWSMRDETGTTSGLMAVFVSATDRVALQEQREDFVATLTHDLKTPILAANRAVKLLIEGDFGQVSEAQASILETIFQSNESMYKMVQTLLDVYRYDSGAKRLKLGLHDLAALALRLVNELEPLARAKGVRLEARLPQEHADVSCDEEEIRRVLQNLVDNSLKFTPPGGTITVMMSQSAGETTLSVADSGKGIREEDMPKLFQRFWQAASSGRYYASTGLGLYLCRKIIELHGGRIWCESQPGRGSTFSFSIPSAACRTQVSSA